jgi:phage terminase small subunit
MTLTPKQAAFVQEYLIDLNATQAAIRAGYSVRTAQRLGSENLSKPLVADAVTAAMKARSQRTELSQDEVISGIRDTIGRCNQSEAVCDASGKPVLVMTPAGAVAPAYRFEPMAVLRGWELLGKHLGMFTNRHEVNGKLSEQQYGVLVVPATMTIEQWEAEALALNGGK